MIAIARQAFTEAFGLPSSVAREAVVDTGGPQLFSVFVESGIPDQFTYPQTAHIWAQIEQRLSVAYGFPVYFESINAGESRLYKVLPFANILPVS